MAVRVLQEHLESGRPDAWRPAARVLDHAWGRPPEHVVAPEVPVPTTASEIQAMPTAQLLELLRQKREQAAASASASEQEAGDESVASAAGDGG